MAGARATLPAPSKAVAGQIDAVSQLWRDYAPLIQAAARHDGQADAGRVLEASERTTAAMDKAVVMLQTESEERVSELLWIQGAFLALAVLLGVATYLALRQMVLGPLERLIDFAEAVARGDFRARVTGGIDGELGRLKASLERMLASITTKVCFIEGVIAAVADTAPFMILDATGRISHVNRLLLDLVGQALAAIVDIVARTATRVGAMAAMSDTLAERGQGITSNLGSIRAVSDETTTGMRQAADAVSRLSQRTGELKSLIECLRGEQEAECGTDMAGPRALASAS
ncbi:MAG: HAMP domain-containing protein [Solidesulfovibrio sp. DCME]|uniref:HAMP domain-containing protein n=1 Tax=Solidesulfovibrio sp. DCME TaxID=3447380 RepID=UPI003D0A2284